MGKKVRIVDPSNMQAYLCLGTHFDDDNIPFLMEHFLSMYLVY